MLHCIQIILLLILPLMNAVNMTPGNIPPGNKQCTRLAGLRLPTPQHPPFATKLESEQKVAYRDCIFSVVAVEDIYSVL